MIAYSYFHNYFFLACVRLYHEPYACHWKSKMKDKASIISTWVVLVSGIILEYCACFLHFSDAEQERVLWYVGQCFVYAGSMMGVHAYTLYNIRKFFKSGSEKWKSIKQFGSTSSKSLSQSSRPQLRLWVLHSRKDHESVLLLAAFHEPRNVQNFYGARQPSEPRYRG